MAEEQRWLQESPGRQLGVTCWLNNVGRWKQKAATCRNDFIRDCDQERQSRLQTGCGARNRNSTTEIFENEYEVAKTEPYKRPKPLLSNSQLIPAITCAAIKGNFMCNWVWRLCSKICPCEQHHKLTHEFKYGAMHILDFFLCANI